ncbi:unnamed protein product, partial [marine sediment metagenome]
MNNKANGKRLYILLVIISLLSVSGIVRAQQSEFMIQDYIPEKFKDLELRLSSGIRFQGNEIDYSNDFDPYYASEDRNNTNYRHSRDANLSCYS